jgi:SAM-dependent methyltransferase
MSHMLEICLVVSEGIIALFSIIIIPKLFTAKFPRARWLERHTDEIDALPPSSIGLWIALAAGAGLYIEIMIIRLHATYFQLFAYFKNVSLLSCFLGLGIGYARGARRPLATPLIMPFLAMQIILMYLLRFTPIAPYLQSPIKEVIAFGWGEAYNSHIQLLAVYLFLTSIFCFNALCFIPLGHLASRLMMRQQKLVSYGWNLIGSLCGVILFSFVSFAWAPPPVWIAISALTVMAFLYKSRSSLMPSVVAVIIMLGVMAMPFRLNQFDIYSPYQILTVTLSRTDPPVIYASHAWHQFMLDLRDENVRNNAHMRMGGITLGKWSEYYSAPFYFKQTPKDVLIVGSGTGNDVAAALRHGAERIDAVEIDPAILQLGKQLHPESPYQASNVNVINNDARAFIRHTNKRYDLIVYGVLDSLTLLSDRSGGIRLDSYVYTVEAFREARARLKEGGIICLTFGGGLYQDLGRKVFMMLQEAFDGREPIAYKAAYGYGYSFLAGEGLQRDILKSFPSLEDKTAMFSDNKIQADKGTDDWPFFYMPCRQYPRSYAVIMVIFTVVSIVLIFQLIPGAGGGFSIPCFFLGAGFMLVETKGITELALVYGSTWTVVSAVISAILIMAFFANLVVMKMGKAPSPAVTYGLLFAALAAGLISTCLAMGKLPSSIERMIMTILLTLPLFFSGFSFSTELDKSVSVSVALSSNLLGAMLGGFLEYNSMYFGFRVLYLIAFIMYLLAFLWSSRAGRQQG